LKVSFHSHSRFCDGIGDPEEYVLSAIQKGFSAFGFSSHAPLPFYTDWNMKITDLPEYIQLTHQLQVKYKDQIELYTGLESDFFDGCTDWRTTNGIQYTLGAVHFLPHPITNVPLPVDGNVKEFQETLEHGFYDDIQLFGEAYYGALREMMLTTPPNILAHIDVFRKTNGNGKYFKETEHWYQEEIEKTLEIALLSDVIIEVNTGGMSRGYTEIPYPSWWVLENILDAGIPIMLNSDVHHPDHVDFAYDSVLLQLKKIGFRTQRVLYNNIWQEVPLG